MNKDYSLYTRNGNTINITTFGNENIEFFPCLIFVHGFKGFKDWGFGPYIGDYFSKRGFFVITFNFSHNGIGNSVDEFVELEKFANNTFSLEVEELSEVIDHYIKGFFGFTSNKEIFLLGHSRGGAVSLITGRMKPEVSKVAVWASIAELDRYSERQKEEWKKNGVLKVLNSRTNQEMKLNLSLLEDIEKNKNGSLNIEKAVKDLKKPLFIAHGEQDLAVPIKEAEQLYEWSDKQLTEFYKITGSGHTFDIKHPFEGSNKKFDNLLEKTLIFFKKNTEDKMQSTNNNTINLTRKFSKVLDKDIFWILMFTILTAISAQVSIPVKPVPFTLQTVFVILAGAFLGARRGAYSQLFYLFLGFIGFPVFAEASFGPSIFVGPTGGYLLAFPVGAFLTGWMIEKNQKYFNVILSMFLGNAVIILLGTLFLNVFYLHNWNDAIRSGAIIFSIWTIIKIIISATVFYKIGRLNK